MTMSNLFCDSGKCAVCGIEFNSSNKAYAEEKDEEDIKYCKPCFYKAEEKRKAKLTPHERKMEEEIVKLNDQIAKRPSAWQIIGIILLLIGLFSALRILMS